MTNANLVKVAIYRRVKHYMLALFVDISSIICNAWSSTCCWYGAGQLAGRKGAIVANANLVKVAIHRGLKHYMLAPLPRGKGAKKRAELGLTVSQFAPLHVYT